MRRSSWTICVSLVSLCLLFMVTGVCFASYEPGPAPTWILSVMPGSTDWYCPMDSSLDFTTGAIHSMTTWSSDSSFEAVVDPGTWLIFGPAYFDDYDFDPLTGQLVEAPYPTASTFISSISVSGDSGFTTFAKLPGDPRPYATFDAWQAPLQPGTCNLTLDWDADYWGDDFVHENVTSIGRVQVVNNNDTSPVPEPGSLALLGSSLLSLPWLLRKRSWRTK